MRSEGKDSRTGVFHVGARISAASIENKTSSSASSSSMSF